MKERKDYISFLSVLSCMAVVLLHANGVFWTFSYDRYWRTANVIESLFYFAVPVFLMISGATLLDYRQRYDSRTYLKKRMQKTLLPFFFWSLIGLGYSILRQRTAVEDLTLLSVWNGIVNCSYVSIYWYFPALFTVYLCIPVFGLIPENRRKNIFAYVIGLFFALNALLPFFASLSGEKLQVNGSFSMPLGSNYLIYILLGYWIDRYEIPQKGRIAAYALGLAGLLAHILGTQQLSFAAGTIVRTFKGYQNVPCILYAAAIFIFAKYFYLYLQEKHPGLERKIQKILHFFTPETFGVYLIHWYILDTFRKFSFVDPRSIVFRLGGGLLVFLLSAILVKLLRKISFVKKYLLP